MILLPHPPEPTAEQCTAHAPVADFNGMKAFACWYPPMGGYVSRCVVVDTGKRDDGEPGCFEVYVWHDGEFPFTADSDDDYRPPAHLHHCGAEQFVEFGRTVLKFHEGNP